MQITAKSISIMEQYNTPLTANIVPSAAASGQTFLPGGLILKWGIILQQVMEH